MITIDCIALEAAFMNFAPETSYWLDRRTGRVLSSNDWSRYEARKLGDPNETDDPNVRLAWCLLWENAEVGSEPPTEEEQAKVRAIMEPLISIPWRPHLEEDHLQRDVDDWLRSNGLLDEPEEE